MAAELDYRANGVASVFVVKQSAWHREGTVWTDAPSLKEGMHTGGLDFEVDLRPMRTSFEIAGGDTLEIDVPEHRAVVRTDRMNTEGVLGVVGPSYHVLQNSEAFAPLEPLLDAGIATLETGGALRGGRDVWMMVKFDIDNAQVRDSMQAAGTQPYGLISNNHNGMRKVTLQETPIRVVCANTLGFALQDLSKAIQVRHTVNVKSKTINAAQQLFSTLTERYITIAMQYDLLRATTMSAEMFEKAVLNMIAELPEAPKGEQKNQIAQGHYERALARAEAKRARLIDLRSTGDGHTGDGSAWEAYNAVTQSMDHDTDLWKVSGESRVTALFDGALGKTKQAALDSIYAAVKSGTAGKSGLIFSASGL
jgi:phage/plasmid-like protein (TIGR03299 family)